MRETGINIEPYEMIFEWIIEDEKRHEQILKVIKNLIVRSNNQP
jgi:rubrerythrin